MKDIFGIFISNKISKMNRKGFMKIKKKTDPSIQTGLTERLFPVRNRRGDITKNKLIQATMDLILEHGIQSVTFDAVGQRRAMSAAQVKYHFGEKSYLIEQTIKYAVLLYQECIVEAVKGKKGPFAQISSLLEGVLDFVRTHPKPASLFLLFFHSASVFPKYRELHTQMLSSGMKRMETILAPIASKEALSPNEVKSLSLAIWAMIDGFFIYAATTEGERSIEQMRKDALFSLKRFLGK
jgi:AcrR family transcriptional regulator